jgi:hypothetical protein
MNPIGRFAGGVAVRTMTSDMLRDTAIEEITVILLRFASCVGGTVMVSDTRAATWSQDQ